MRPTTTRNPRSDAGAPRKNLPAGKRGFFSSTPESPTPQPASAGLEFHPLADIFPLLEGADFEELVEDIRAHGVREPIWLYDGKILDGRNRYRAVLVAGVPFPTRTYEGNDPLAFVISLNLKRRHLSESQRAMVAAKLAALRDGQRADLVEGLPIGRAAELLNVSERTIARAREVQEHGAPELVQAVEQDSVSVSAAADIAALPIEKQRDLLAKLDKRTVLEAANEIRTEKAEARRAARIARMIEISKGNADLPTDRRYPIILVDPPWRYERPSFGLGNLDPDDFYPTMALDEICSLPVGDLALHDALLFLWVPAPILAQAFQVIQAWGFEYRTGMVWDKQSSIPGRYIRQQHEHLLIARRGEFPTPPDKDRPPSVISARRRQHSRKPDEAYEAIERMYPELPKIELFARHKRDGWYRWGNEAPSDDVGDGLDIPGFLRRRVS